VASAIRDTARNGHRRNLAVLAEYLTKFYGADHEVVVYEAGFTAGQRRLVKIPLHGLAVADVTAGSTLYVPVKDRPIFRAEIAERLGMSREALGSVARSSVLGVRRTETCAVSHAKASHCRTGAVELLIVQVPVAHVRHLGTCALFAHRDSPCSRAGWNRG
jgi:hypothetical protein